MFDRLLAIFGLIFSSPLMLLIAIAIKLDSKGHVLFKQERTGKGGKNFYIYKFRTMVEKNDVHAFSKADEHTKIGKTIVIYLTRLAINPDEDKIKTNIEKINDGRKNKKKRRFIIFAPHRHSSLLTI